MSLQSKQTIWEVNHKEDAADLDHRRKIRRMIEDRLENKRLSDELKEELNDEYTDEFDWKFSCDLHKK